MPLNTDFNQAPFHDDYDEEKNFHRILFKPTVSVQVRELNQIQTILQKQIERFGDNVFKRGTIISGVNFDLDNKVGYVKMKDTETDGSLFTPAYFVDYIVREESSNLVAKIIKYADGYESLAPDTKTLYVKYINAGADSNTFAFTPGQTLRIYDGRDSLGKTEILNGSTGFANNDAVVFVSRVAVNVTSSNAFSNGEAVTSSSGARAVIAGISTDVDGYSILRLKPYANDISNSAVTNTWWVFTTNTTITGATSLAAGSILNVYGSGAQARITTDGVGKVVDLEITNHGSGYAYDPFVTLKASSGSAGNYTDLNLGVYNYFARIQSSVVANSVGTSYMMSTTGGVIYQKGYFIRTEPQSIIVSKYSPTPNNVSVVFATEETIVDANEDSTLFDNIMGTPNRTAPGADRLRLTPTLMVMNTSTASSNDQVFILASFSEGNTFRQKQITEYNTIGDEMARRTNDASGNFVLDPFMITTRSPANTALEANTISVVVDPGRGYVSGYRVETFTNYVFTLPKGSDTNTNNNFSLSLSYDNYVRVNEVGGLFQFSTGDLVSLYDTAMGFVSNTAAVVAGSLVPSGTQIGTARVRSMVLESGTAGTSAAIYRMYLFSINMNAGANFKSVKSIYYNGSTYKGISDTVLEVEPTTGASVAKIYGKNDKLLFSAAVPTVLNATEVNYIYRTVSQSTSLANNGTFSLSLAASPDKIFPYTSSSQLSDSQLRDLYVVPASNNLLASVPVTGTGTVTTTSNVIVGSGTTYLSDFVVGDWVYLYSNTTAFDIKKVAAVQNNTHLRFESNTSFANTTTYVKRYFPKNVPVPFGYRTGLTANTDGTSDVLTVNFGMAFDTASATTMVVGYNVKRVDAAVGTKQANRNLAVRLNLSNNAANTVGPWCLGVPDIIRLRGVYVGNSTVNTTNGTDVTRNFYIDHNHTTNYADLGFLYSDPTARYVPLANQHMLVLFDAINTVSTGYYNSVSYLTANTTRIFAVDSVSNVSSLGANIHSFELPEMYSDKGEYFDMLNTFDFRPIVTPTASITNVVASATVNPPYTISFGNTADPANDKMFPLPDSTLNGKLTYFVGNTYAIRVHKSGEIRSHEVSTPVVDSVLLDVLQIPGYPAIPENKSLELSMILNTKMASELYATARQSSRTVKSVLNKSPIKTEQNKRYTNRDFAALERRIAALEYYTSLSLLETELKGKVIPSSITPDVNRFKYGLFVDDFSSQSHSNLNSPEYAATIRNQYLFPLEEIINITHEIDDFASLQYDNIVLVEQLIATQEAATAPPPPPPVPNTAPNTTPNTTPPTPPTPPRNDGVVAVNEPEGTDWVQPGVAQMIWDADGIGYIAYWRNEEEWRASGWDHRGYGDMRDQMLTLDDGSAFNGSPTYIYFTPDKYYNEQ